MDIVSRYSRRNSTRHVRLGHDKNRGPLEQRFALSMRVSGGAANLDDGIGTEQTQWAMASAFGLQALYGVSAHLSVEATLDFVRTDAVAFTDVVWDQMTGQLDVRETSGRLLAGGLVHTGERWIPYARAAVGARFSRRTTSMASRSESEVRAGVLFAFGGGLNLVLSKRIVAGTSLTLAAPIGGSDSSLTAEAGFHLGATWDLAGPWR